MSGASKELLVICKSTILTIFDSGIGIVVSRRVDHSNWLVFVARHLAVAICVSEVVQKLQKYDWSIRPLCLISVVTAIVVAAFAPKSLAFESEGATWTANEQSHDGSMTL